ncbi:MAG: histidine kinase, partial [Sulfurimonas sp.]|nr:histidine kinase [Sulfurimonas sp.]
TFAYIAIEDNAGGIKSSLIDKIFDPYFSTKKAKGGTGLGLYMSNTIIKEHCTGSLDVQNIENGAKFLISLPLGKGDLCN